MKNGLITGSSEVLYKKVVSSSISLVARTGSLVEEGINIILVEFSHLSG